MDVETSGTLKKMSQPIPERSLALNVFTAQKEQFLHLPLDRDLIGRLAVTPSSWSSWTKVVVHPATQQQVVAEYLQIQDSFRRYWHHLNSTKQRFASPLEMEQLLWHRGINLVEVRGQRFEGSVHWALNQRQIML